MIIILLGLTTEYYDNTQPGYFYCKALSNFGISLIHTDHFHTYREFQIDLAKFRIGFVDSIKKKFANFGSF